VDDDHDAVAVMAMLLEGRGFTVAAAYNGQEALAYFENGGDACLVVLDLLMPVMTGMEFLAERRRRPRLAGTPVIVLTATDAHVRHSGQIVLHKPVDSEALFRQIDALCA
jgi:CheY-like chemotaxis protein